MRLIPGIWLARRSQRQLGEWLTLIDPIDYKLLRGVSFYDLFIDRRRWPEMIRQAYSTTRRTRRVRHDGWPDEAAPRRHERPQSAAGVLGASLTFVPRASR